VEQDRVVLAILVQRRRNQQAAKKFFRKLLKGCPYVPRVLITDTLNSDGAATRTMRPGVEHRQNRDRTNGAANLQQPRRPREQRLQQFKSPGQAPRFLAAYGPSAQPFRPHGHCMSAPESRHERKQRVHVWGEITGVEMIA